MKLHKAKNEIHLSIIANWPNLTALQISREEPWLLYFCSDFSEIWDLGSTTYEYPFGLHDLMKFRVGKAPIMLKQFFHRKF